MLMSVVRTFVLYAVVILCMRLMGKRQVGDLQPSELVVTMMIAELASIPMQDLDRPVINGVIAIFVLTFIEIVLSVITLKSPFFRKILEGKSAIIIKDGVIDQKMMKKLRVTIDDLLEGIRQEGVFSIDTVDFAIMETNGKLTVQKKAKEEPVTPKDLELDVDKKSLPTVIISDGKLIESVFDEFSVVKRKDAMEKLKKKHLEIKDVFLMTVNENKEFVIVRKEK
jgi:uncharacterized membrane protein YcaP (DUF421 family)